LAVGFDRFAFFIIICLQVYLTLCVALASSAVGAYLHVVWNVGGMLTMLGCVASIAWLFSVPVYEEVRPVRLSFVVISSPS
jgi:hypothetical protein